MNQKKTFRHRESNFELLRVIAMLMIVAHHFVVHGVMHYETAEQFICWADGVPLNKIMSVFLFPGGEVGVALFFIISGYFNINKSKGSVLKVLTQVSFYGIISLAVYIILKLFRFSYDELSLIALAGILRTIILPGTSGSYWFISVYTFVILLMPMVNPLLQKLNKAGLFQLLVFFWLFWYSLAVFFSVPYYNLQKGLFFYCIGSYIRLHYSKRNSILRLSILFIIGWTIGAVIAYGIAYTSISMGQTSIGELVSRVFIALESSISVPACSISLFLLFHSLDIGINRRINSIAATTLGVYLIHDLSIWRKVIWYRILRVDTVLYNSRWFPLISIVVIISVFSICSLIDLIRLTWIEQPMNNRVKKVLDRVKSHNVNMSQEKL